MSWIREEYSEFRTLLILCKSESEAEIVVDMLVDEGFSWHSEKSTEMRETFWRVRAGNTGVWYLVYLDEGRIYHTRPHYITDPDEEPCIKIDVEEFVSRRSSEEPYVPSELTQFLVGIMGT